ncbi:cation:proton antiporter [Mycolicibacterium sp. S2-37]|uniref:cation:proton antiporter domain-containing protein n=1 Tax=Mycolicibacterium sp. S2-37 TaxID=2810297 RepID=UPI001A93E764|nr:cation:proton antiporter [Mycolicibacterium sp. S2-37]MBO0680145.1 cation:proton antiporter [Mycolicibacterium sp. S2-37]
MLLSLIAASGVLAVWSLLGRRMEAWRLTAPMVMVLAGVAVGLTADDKVSVTLNTGAAEHVAEIILAVLLFVDATDVRGGLFGGQPRAAMRLLFLAMPLSLVAAMVLGWWLLPGLPVGVLVVIACIVVPIDFAPAASILRDARIPVRVRNLLNVEAGYNDGIVSPLFIFALVLAEQASGADTPLEALGHAVPEALIAVLVGLAVGAALAVAANAAQRRQWMTHQSARLLLVAAPLLAFGLSLSAGGNGFVAAFVCGIALNNLRRSHDIRVELELVDDVGFLLAMVMWLAFGAVSVIALQGGVSVGVVVFCLLALTVVRIVPVVLSLLGSRLTWRERLLVGGLGPRGTTSIVFGLLAFNALEGGDEQVVVLVTVVAVLSSIVLHGAGAPAVARAHARTREAQAGAEGK